LADAPLTDDLSETLLEFPDNYLLIDLCGEFDRNLATLEEALDVQILRRGNQLAVIAEPDQQAEAVRVLKALYQRLEAGKSLEGGDIDAELRMTADAPVAPVSLDDDARVEIKTRKKLVEPRTDAQKAYVRSLFENELAFGIGPAGTGKTYLAVAVGVNMFISGHVDRIILSRPAVEAGEKLGYLPGDMKDNCRTPLSCWTRRKTPRPCR